MMDIQERHDRHHASLQQQQERIDRRWASARDRARTYRIRGARRFADQQVRSLRVTLAAGWAAHLRLHGLTPGLFESVADRKRRHEEAHQ